MNASILPYVHTTNNLKPAVQILSQSRQPSKASCVDCAGSNLDITRLTDGDRSRLRPYLSAFNKDLEKDALIYP